MRVLHVCDSYLPQLGGIELHVHDLAARQRSTGDEAHVATLTAAREENAEVGVVRLPRSGPFPRCGVKPQLDRLMDEHDVVHAHVSLLSPLAWAAVRRAARLQLPTLVTMHSMLPRGASAHALRPLMGQVPSSTVLTAVSTVAAEAFRRVVPARDVFVLPNGIEPSDWQPLRERAPDGPLTLVSTMRTARRKRPIPLLRILRDVRRAVPPSIDVRAVLIGAGPLDRVVERKLAGSDLESWVVRLGRLERPEVLRILSSADLYLAPATLESFGLAALEARCAGLPVIGMARSGLGDFIDDRIGGHLVATDKQMATVTARLLTHPEQLAAMRAHNLRHPPPMDWSTVLRQHRQLYAYAGEAAYLQPDQRDVYATASPPAH